MSYAVRQAHKFAIVKDAINHLESAPKSIDLGAFFMLK